MSEMETRWHAGERALHERLGIAARMEEVGQRAIRRFMPDQHRNFFGQLPFIFIGSKDESGRLWASMLSGAPGFISSPSPALLDIRAMPMTGDPLREMLVPGSALGTLGIELPTRRRNRANGRIVKLDAAGFILEVEESFGNCPKYIVRRDYLPDDAPPPPPIVQPITGLDADARHLIRLASTFFVASAGGALPDVSHRGGRPGFVTLAGDTLIIPDYAGNLFFNTLGNLFVYPQAGLLFPDFATGDLLQLTGSTELQGVNAAAPYVPGEGSFWRFHAAEGRWLRNAFRIHLGEGELSPFSPNIVNQSQGELS